MNYSTCHTPISHYRLPFRWELVQYVEGDRNYSRFVLIHKSPYLYAKTLCIFQANLPSFMIRVHKGYIVNKRFIKEIDFLGRTLIMADGNSITVARRRWKEIWQELYKETVLN